MRSVLIMGIVLILTIAFTCPVMAQEAPVPEQIKKFEPIIGYWKNQEETRNSPTDSWVKSSSEWELKWAVEGHCVLIDGRTATGGSYMELYGYDPNLNTVIASSFNSEGGKSYCSSSGWDGTIYNFNVSSTAPDGSESIVRCAFVHSSDFKSQTGTCEMFTDGRWWVFRKVQGTKVK